MATRLYAIHLSRHVKGCVKGPAPAVPAQGILCDITPQGFVVPDRAAVSQCLPPQYRKAFARSGMSQTRGNEGTYHWDLHDTRGRYFNTVYAIGYDFEPVGPHKVEG
jgi:hypothetical protein